MAAPETDPKTPADRGAVLTACIHPAAWAVELPSRRVKRVACPQCRIFGRTAG